MATLQASLTIWFDWAAPMIAGLGVSNAWNAEERLRFGTVIEDLIALFDGRHDLAILALHEETRPSLRTLAIFLLERLSCEGGQTALAFSLSEKLRRDTDDMYFASWLAAFQLHLVRCNPALVHLSHLPWPSEEILEKRLEAGRPVPSDGPGQLAHRRLNALMSQFFQRAAVSSEKRS